MAVPKDLILQSCLELLKQDPENIESILARYPEYAEDLRPDLEAALWLSQSKVVFDARPGFVDASRHRVIERIKRQNQAANETTGWWRNLSWNEFLLSLRGVSARLAIAALLIFLVFFSSVGLAFASQNAIPGDRLYGVKRSLENVHLAVTRDPARRAGLQIDYAQRRLTEIQSLVMKGRYDEIPAVVENYEYLVNQALANMQQVAKSNPPQAARLAAALKKQLSNQEALLGMLASTVPETVRPEIQRMLEVSSIGASAAEAVLRATQNPTNTQTADLTGTPEPSLAMPIVGPELTATPEPGGTLSSTPQRPEVTLATPGVPWLTLPVSGGTIVPEAPKTPTPTPTATATATPTATPTATLEPSETPKPPPTHKAKPTRKPTKTPKPKITHKPDKTEETATPNTHQIKPIKPTKPPKE